VRVGPGAVLRECVVPANVVIGAHAELGPGVVVAPDTTIPDGARVDA
jgi:acetyltransferase-like isoleucine patch superfamily enzyme